MTRAAPAGIVLRCVVAVLLAIAVFRLCAWLFTGTFFPFGIDYGEGIVWKQMIEIMAGRGYAPVAGYPAIVFHYTPLYHLVSGAVASLGVGGLLAGRIVSSLATLGSMACIAGLIVSVARPPAGRWPVLLGAAFGAAAFGGFYAVRYWAPLMRVDPLGIMLELAGLACAVAAIRRPRLIHPAAALFVAAFFTKQTEMFGPVAAFGVLLLARPRTALAGIAAAIVLGAGALAALLVTTHGHFLDHVLYYNINRFDFAQVPGRLRVSVVKADLIVMALGAAGAVLTLVSLIARFRTAGRAVLADGPAVAGLLLLTFLTLKTVSLVLIGKNGSSSNYIVEWEASVAIFAGIAVTAIVACFERNAARAAVAVPLFGLVTILSAILAFAPHDRRMPDLDALRSEGIRVARVAASIKGDVISDDMVMLLQTGHDVTWEPAIFLELASLGRYDERPIIAAIRDGRIGAVILHGSPDNTLGPWISPAIAAAIRRSLPVERQIGFVFVHTAAPKRDAAAETARP